MPLYRKPGRNPWLPTWLQPAVDTPSVLDLMPQGFAVGMAAREPSKFLAQKLASYFRKMEQIRAEHTALQRAAMTEFGTQGGAVDRWEHIAELLQGQDKAQPFLEDTLGSIDDMAMSSVNRAKKALDLWRLRNLPIGEAFERSAKEPLPNPFLRNR